MSIPAITVHQYWADAIVDGYKDVENRTWRTAYRGPLFIHAGKSKKSMPASDRVMRAIAGIPANTDPVLGAIVGIVDLVDIVSDSESLWAEPGELHWLLANPRRIEPIYCTGKLNLWQPDPAIVGQVKVLDSLQRVANTDQSEVCQLDLFA